MVKVFRTYPQDAAGQWDESNPRFVSYDSQARSLRIVIPDNEDEPGHDASTWDGSPIVVHYTRSGAVKEVEIMDPELLLWVLRRLSREAKKMLKAADTP